MLGYITIPSINAVLPIYEGTEDAILQRGIGHLKENENKKTSFPFLRKGKNCILTGHSGLSTSKLFSDLDMLKKGDSFYVKSNGKYYQYEVKAKYKKIPEEAKQELKVKKNKDFCTLITCVPIYVNTHRLIVRGERVKYDGSLNSNKLKQNQNSRNKVAATIAFLFIFMVFVLIHLQKYHQKLIYRRSNYGN